ncbi:MAG: alpha/beta hydrolase [Burkholderiales bacterium]|nr:alpha/beta hydrolase [Burkholderiales bacterium]
MSDLFAPHFTLERRRVGEVTLNVRHDVGRQPDALPVLLLHGFPQTHAIWHRVAVLLEAQAPGRYTLVMPDLRGYGDSDKPAGDAEHVAYSKRAMAADMHALMSSFGFERYMVCGHDRGGRVAHRLALDTPRAVERLMLLDISPTLTMYERTTMEFARLYYHWFFLIQPAPLPERLIGADPRVYLRTKLSSLGSSASLFDPRAFAEYERCFADPAAIHAMCEDYRAAATIDLEHDRADADQRLACPVHVLWGARGVVHRLFTPLADWQAKCAAAVTGGPTPGGHYIPEESPELLVRAMQAFFVDIGRGKNSA